MLEFAVLRNILQLLNYYVSDVTDQVKIRTKYNKVIPGPDQVDYNLQFGPSKHGRKCFGPTVKPLSRGEKSSEY